MEVSKGKSKRRRGPIISGGDEWDRPTIGSPHCRDVVEQTPLLSGSMASVFLTYPPWPGCTTFLTGEDPRSLALNPILQTPGLLCIRTWSAPMAPMSHHIPKEEIRSSEALRALLNHLDLIETLQRRNLINCDGSALIYCISLLQDLLYREEEEKARRAWKSARGTSRTSRCMQAQSYP